MSCPEPWMETILEWTGDDGWWRWVLRDGRVVDFYRPPIQPPPPVFEREQHRGS